MDINIKKILILGSGGLRIGQAGEFDYSGSQAIKAFKEENITTVLINPNIATVQTDSSMADHVYFLPLNLKMVCEVIEKEKPDAITCSFGGQTALNLGLELEQSGILETYQVKVLGTSLDIIRITEDREKFKQSLAEANIQTAKSMTANSLEEAYTAADLLGFPLMVRCAFTLGGLGSGRVNTQEELSSLASTALKHTSQILLEEFLEGWKEIEYEIVRDCDGNTLTICNMENMDPMGIHTGESIVVAPSQTLNNQEYHLLRAIAIRAANHLNIIGECNIQYALNPKTGDYRVIEMNARLSRSSALASKATGYPLAFVAAKLALGYPLHAIKNSVTGITSAFFEPALDYIVIKIPRWDLQKMSSADHSIGSEMKSIGEVMGIGRTFPEALQKAVRMLNIGVLGFSHHPFCLPNPQKEVQHATDRRLFAIYEFFKQGGSVKQAYAYSHIDPWFLWQLYTLYELEQAMRQTSLTPDFLLKLKQHGFSDQEIAESYTKNFYEIRTLRKKWKITPYIKQIDTLAGEFAAETNYLYTTYHAQESDLDSPFSDAILVLGSGPYAIGSSVEFDWCAVNTSRTLRQLGYSSIMINSNPETVSTDFDESERLYFEELSLERVLDIAEFESPEGIIVSVGGQIANNLALSLDKEGFSLLGTKAESIDQAENRHKFSSLLSDLQIDQPQWTSVASIEEAKQFAQQIGYPLLIRPSYVLSGAAMNTARNEKELSKYLENATKVSPKHPVVLSQFILEAKELEVDGVADHGIVVIDAVSEHIENAGVHSGDATIVLPPQRLYLETIRRTKQITRQIAKALDITGPFNIQFIAKNNQIKVIECNLRASRSFPFVSKVTGHNLIEIATRVMLGQDVDQTYETLELDYVGVKSPQFSYRRLKGSNPVAHVEMASTGEVACLGSNLTEAFYLSWLATEKKVQGKRIILSIGGEKKSKLFPFIQALEEKGWKLHATPGTHEYLVQKGVGSICLFKVSDQLQPNITTAIEEKWADLIINIPRSPTGRVGSDGFLIRRLAIEHDIPLITDLQIAYIFLQCLLEEPLKNLKVLSQQEYLTRQDTRRNQCLAH